jgi:hypothetical protein
VVNHKVRAHDTIVVDSELSTVYERDLPNLTVREGDFKGPLRTPEDAGVRIGPQEHGKVDEPGSTWSSCRVGADAPVVAPRAGR